MKTLIALFGMLLLLCSCGNKTTEEEKGHELAVDTVPMMVMQIQKCSRLYTAEYNIHKIVAHDDAMRLKGNILNHNFNVALPMGDRKIAIPMNATLKAYIDFSQFSAKNIEQQGDNITIVLPDPKVMLTSSKVDQKEIKQFVSLTRSHFTDAEMASYEQQGRQAIIASIPKYGILKTAQENAAKVIIPMVEQMGYKEENITVVFRKEFTINDLTKIVEQ